MIEQKSMILATLENEQGSQEQQKRALEAEVERHKRDLQKIILQLES